MSWKYNTEEFIDRARICHGMYSYDYSLVHYTNARTKIKIICNKCGNIFEMTPDYHLSGHGCPIEQKQKISDMHIDINAQRFIKKAQKIHGNHKYNYSKVKYINSRTKVSIVCNECGNCFEQTPSHHLRGQGCPVEGLKKLSDGNRSNKKEFIEKSKKIHKQNYDYSHVIYKGARIKVKIVCNTCGNIFMQLPYSHLSGRGCPLCAIQKRVYVLRGNTKDFIKKSRNIHVNHQYDYSKVNYVDSDTKVVIICNNCNNSWTQKPYNHLSGYGCPHCIQSKGENFIEAWLLTENLEFQQQYRIEACRSKRALPFDFAVFVDDKILLIEYNGEQHYRPVAFGGSEKTASKQYKGIVHRDAIKRSYCLNNNVPLLTIPYWTTQEDMCVQLKRFISTASMSR